MKIWDAKDGKIRESRFEKYQRCGFDTSGKDEARLAQIAASPFFTAKGAKDSSNR